MTQDADKRHKLMAHMDKMKTQKADTTVFGKLFIDEGDLCIDGREYSEVARQMRAYDLHSQPPLNPDVFPEIVRRWNLVGEAEAAEDGAMMALATVIGERDAARAEVERQKHRADNHAETLRGVRKWLTEGDADRALLWCNDGLSGYTDTAENTLAEAISSAEKAETERDAALSRVAELESQLDDAVDSHEVALRQVHLAAGHIAALTPPPDAELDALIREIKVDAVNGEIDRRLAGRIITALRARKGGAA